jgi:Domain of unknown function (DUF4136)
MARSTTMTTGKRIGTAGVMMIVATAVALAGVKVKVQKDEKFNFAQLKTWAWNPSGPGEVKVWLTADSKSEPVQRQYEPVIMQAVEEQFPKRGYSLTKGNPPDFTVTYYVLVTSGASSQEVGQFMPTNAQWGIRPWSPQTTSVTYYPHGTLVLDVASPPAGDLIWRGLAEAKIESDKTDAQRADRVRGIIKDVLAKFPQRK